MSTLPLTYHPSSCPHTYGVRVCSCAASATNPYRPTACISAAPFRHTPYRFRPRPTTVWRNLQQHPRCADATTILHSSFLILNWSHTFSAKERDAETGLSYFGARYYRSDLSIWLSVDPMSDKYPSLSPYVYCADNPVKLVDPNGEDYVVVVDEKKQTMTIKAIYYTANDNKSELQEGLDIWNSQSGSFYHKMNGKNYEVIFDLQVAEGDFSTDSEARSAAFGDGKMSVNNYFEKSSPGVNKRGATTDGNIIQLDPEIGGKRSLAHEIGHTIGIGEWTFGLMSQGTEETQITRRNVLQTMARAGLGRKPTATHFYNNPIDLETRWSHVGKGSFFTVVNGY